MAMASTLSVTSTQYTSDNDDADSSLSREREGVSLERESSSVSHIWISWCRPMMEELLRLRLHIRHLNAKTNMTTRGADLLLRRRSQHTTFVVDGMDDTTITILSMTMME